MPSFGATSNSVLAELDSRLQAVMNAAIKRIDFSLITGFRGQAAQHAAFVAKNSKLDWPNSRHNTRPSMAVDLLPYPRSNDLKRFQDIANVILEEASRLNIPIRWGGDWDRNGTEYEGTFIDAGHFEIPRSGQDRISPVVPPSTVTTTVNRIGNPNFAGITPKPDTGNPKEDKGIDTGIMSPKIGFVLAIMVGFFLVTIKSRGW